MFRLESVKKQYKDFVLDVTMEVRTGYVTGVIGKNGAGKTTAFKAGLGLIHLDGGEVTVFGKPLAKLDEKDKEMIGVVLADSGFCGYMNIKDWVSVLEHMYSNFQKQFFLDKCEVFGLPLKKQIRDFSTGMRRKLQLIAALSHDAKLLILDEPTAGLDVVARDELLTLLREYMEDGERSILISSHISGDLEGLCDDIYMIDEGRILFHEEADKLLDSYGLLKMTKEQYEKVEKEHLLRVKQEEYGYSALTDKKQFYMENYPDVIIEKGNIDEVIMMVSRGEKL
ncbi:MAG: ABC transporter ATP-binding protein [Lachnospiraceae bacterium]